MPETATVETKIPVQWRANGAEIDIGGQKKNYIGCTEGEFKTRYNGHKDSFKNEKKKASTTLSSIVWANNKNPSPQISWSILKKTHKYQAGSRICDLCEKTGIT